MRPPGVSRSWWGGEAGPRPRDPERRRNNRRAPGSKLLLPVCKAASIALDALHDRATWAMLDSDLGIQESQVRPQETYMNIAPVIQGIAVPKDPHPIQKKESHWRHWFALLLSCVCF